MNAEDKSSETTQTKAQYGRTMLGLTKPILEELGGLSSTSVFCDIGHGIGTVVLDAAFTVGCESRGIEVVGGRNLIANEIRDLYLDCHKTISAREGKVRFSCCQEDKERLQTLFSRVCGY